ncbi:MAG: methylmalonyl Co-A mutase-associated GTPase MeaB, partial [Microlunatus sp.]|nr:methylmalonyl Co-A mutase-associated GTPase MeaB [Microlunatus sp.]
RARVIGLTGAPGVGKSTTVAALITALRAQGHRVAVLAVDPSSPFSGGALLGDRVRMQQHALDTGVFIRSMATRGHLGGLAVAAPQAVRVLDAAGFDTVLVETVGVGQSEVEVAAQVDVTVVLLAPGMGDGIQAAKAGVLEIGDLFVVNKADREGAHSVVRELRNMVALADRGPEDWKPPVLSTTAADGTGIAKLLDELDRFSAHATGSGLQRGRRELRARREVESLVLASLRAALPTHGGAGLEGVATEVAAGRLDPYTAADRVLSASTLG